MKIPTSAMFTKTTARRVGLRLAFLALGVSLVVFVVTRVLDVPAAPIRPKVVVEPVPHVVSHPVPDPLARPAEAIRREIVQEHMVEILVSNANGHPLSAEVACRETTIFIQGSGWIDRSVGNVTVSSVGYLPNDVEVRGERVEVVLQPACTLRGIVFDAATGSRVVGASVSLEKAPNGEVIRTGLTDDKGEFFFPALAPARLVVHGQATGYVPFCEGPTTLSPGIELDIQEDLRVEIPVFPVYAALCAVRNSTNLGDDVLRALVACSFSEQPGRELPQWFGRDVSTQMSEASKVLGITLAYGQACCMDRAPQSLSGRVDFVVRGQSAAGSAAVIFQPLQDLLRNPVPSIHTIAYRWDVGTLTVEAPITLRIASKSRIVFGGLQTMPGSFVCELPHGTYVVSPIDGNPLLDPESWTREVVIPKHGKVEIAPAEGFATLQLIDEKHWPGGVVAFSGRRASMGIPLKNLPVSMPVSPGTYSFSVVRGSGMAETVVWTREVTLNSGDSKVLRIASD
jgi:hypothetical protein